MRSRVGWIYLLPVTAGARVAVLGTPGDPVTAEVTAALTEAGAEVRVTDRLDGAGERLLALVVVRGPAGDEWASLHDVLAPGGVAIVLPGAAGRRPWGVARALRRAGFEDVETFLVLPGGEDPRLLAPISGGPAMRGALRLHAATNARARIAHRVLPIAAAMGLLHLAPAQIVVARRAGEGPLSLAEEIGAALHAGGRPALLNPSAGVGLKVIMRFADRGGSALAYAKAAGPGPRAAGLAHEAEVLRELLALSAREFRVPAVLDAGRWGMHEYLVTAPLTEDRAPALDGVTEPVLAAMVAMARAGGGRDALEASGTVARIEASTAVPPVVHRAVRRALEIAGDTEVPLGIGHGDFVAWNVREVPGGVAVFDWEWATRRAAPFLDLYHFVVHTERNVGGRPVAEVVREHFFEADGVGAGRAREYGGRIGLVSAARTRVSFAALLLYLADWCVVQAEHGNDGGQAQEHLHLLEALLSDETSASRWRV